MPQFHKTSEIQEGAKVGEGTKIWQHSQVLKGAEMGESCVIGHNCFVGAKAKLGKGVKLQSNVDVWDRVTLEDYVFVGPSVVFTNDRNPRAKYPKSEYPEYGEWVPTLVKEEATIGANATIVCGVVVGKCSFVGAGAVVTKDVPDYAIVLGNPSKQVGWVCECGNKIKFEKVETECKVCHKKYKKENDKVFRL